MSAPKASQPQEMLFAHTNAHAGRQDHGNSQVGKAEGHKNRMPRPVNLLAALDNLDTAARPDES